MDGLQIYSYTNCVNDGLGFIRWTHTMKFTLIIFLCFFINNECLPPQEIKQHYNSWKECTLAALEISTEIIRLQEEEFVNNNKVATKFVCKEIGTI